jgi:hypothetical protein
MQKKYKGLRDNYVRPVFTFPELLKEEMENNLDRAKQKEEGSLVNNEP